MRPLLERSVLLALSLLLGAGCQGADRRQTASPPPSGRLVDVQTDRGVHVRAPFVAVDVPERDPLESRDDDD